MAQKIIDKILWIEGFYPFSLKYDLKKAIIEHKQELESLICDPTTKSIVKHSNYFNAYFKDICVELNKVIKKSTLDKSTFIELIVADLNRTELLIAEDSRRSLFSGESFDSNMPANVYISKPEFQNTTEPAWGLIDSAIETATLNLNYLNYVKFKKNIETVDELSQVDVIKNLGLIGSVFNAIKQAYDKIIWREYTIEGNESVIALKSDRHHLMLDNVALTRLMRNVTNTYQELEYGLEDYKAINKLYHSSRKFQIIRSIEEKNNEFILKYQAKTKKPTGSFFSFVAPILTYYPFFHLEKILAFENLTILDLVNLFSSLNDFVTVLPLPEYNDTDVKDLVKFKLFNPKIKKITLINYLKTTTKYSEKQILIFLNLLTQRENKHNLFLYPVYEDQDYYFFSQSTIKRANMLYLVDKWLEIGKCDLASRGFKFEDYIKDFLRNEKLNEFAKFKIIEQSMFSFVDNENIRHQEEIDLVLTTESSIIIAEIKCTTYPLDPDDFYSVYQTLKKAKKQVVRKSNYIEENWSHFEKALGKRNDRKIEKIVIVNFPHFAGRIIDDIPVTDFYLFLSYFQSGKFTNVKIEMNKMMTVNNIDYYNSVKSFENNFEQFFKNPIPIEELILRQKIEEYEVTLKCKVTKTVAERVVYIERTPDNE
jgi:hypothetical protein